jgi:hypothetical protein
VGEEEAEVVVEEEDMGVVVGDIIGISTTMRVHSVTLEHQLFKVLLKMEILQRLLNHVDMVDLVVVVSVVAVVGVLVMKKLVKESVLVELMNVGVGLDVGG